MQNRRTFQLRKLGNSFHSLFRAVMFSCRGAEQIPDPNRCAICCLKRCCVETAVRCGGRELGGELNGRS